MESVAAARPTLAATEKPPLPPPPPTLCAWMPNEPFPVVVMAVAGLAVGAVAYLLWPATSLRADIRRLEAADV